MPNALRRVFVTVLIVPAALLISGSSFAQEAYPDKPIKVIVPFLPGGSVDTLIRIVAPKLTAAWGQPLVVENRAGAGGNVGAEVVAKAQPDGYTILFTPSGPFTLNMFLYDQMPFDASSAFTPVTVLAVMPNMLLVSSKVQEGTIAEFIAEARSSPGKLSYGSPGIGTVSHLTGEIFAAAIDAKFVHVPYKGFPPLLADLLGGRLDFAFLDATNALPQLRKKNLRVLAVADRKRFFALPEIPTFSEVGVRGVEASTWVSFAFPRGVAPTIVRKWQEEIRRVARIPEVQERFQHLGAELWVSTQEEVQRHIDEEKSRWREAILRAGVKKR